MGAVLSNEEIVKVINEVIYEAGDGETVEVYLGDLLLDAKMDSFAYAVFWIDLSTRLDFDIEDMEDLDYKTFKIDDIIEIVNGNK